MMQPIMWLSVGLALLVSTVQAEGVLNRFLEVKSASLPGFDNSGSFRGITLEECAEKCVSDYNCESFEFKSDGGKCDLSDASARTYALVENVQGWDYYHLYAEQDSPEELRTIEYLKAKVEELTAEHSNSTQVYEQAFQKSANLTDLHLTVYSELKDQSNKTNHKELEITRHTERTEELKNQIKELKAKLLVIREEKEEVKTKLGEIERENDIILDQQMILKQEIDMSRISIRSLREAKESMQSSLDKCKEKRNRLSNELTALKKDIVAYKFRLDRAYRPRDCAEVTKQYNMNSNGVYKLYPYGKRYNPTLADCNDGWTLIQKRTSLRQTFKKSWRDYKYGFGNSISEYYLGNEVIHRLTSARPTHLKIEIQKKQYGRLYQRSITYSYFRVLSEASSYSLRVSGPRGQLDDMLSRLNGVPFSTSDHDHSLRQCAKMLSGGWWMKRTSRTYFWWWKKYNCEMSSNLNGYSGSLIWSSWLKYGQVTKITMSIRPATYNSIKQGRASG